MRGVFSTELLNQERDQNHKRHLVHFDEAVPLQYVSKVSKGHASCGWGLHTLFKHQDLQIEVLPFHTQYLKDDTLYIRVTMTERISTSKPWLAGATS